MDVSHIGFEDVEVDMLMPTFPALAALFDMLALEAEPPPPPQPAASASTRTGAQTTDLLMGSPSVLEPLGGESYAHANLLRCGIPVVPLQ
jgi:hypothetical protein